MGYIKEPAGIDLVVDPTPLTSVERKRISEMIAHYKATGKKMLPPKSKIKSRSTNTQRKNISVIEEAGAVRAYKISLKNTARMRACN